MMLFSDDNIKRNIKVQITDILTKHLSKVMHKTRLGTLSLLVGSLFHAKFFSLTGLGRGLETSAQERSAIRRVDRFMANKNVQKDRKNIYAKVCKLLVGSCKRPLIIVDWSTIPNQSPQLLRAALVTSGRALTLYEEVHSEKKYCDPRVHSRFLLKLKSMLPEDIPDVV